MRINGHEIDLSSQDKMFFPDEGLTKGDMVRYYRQVADVMLPHMKVYGVSMQRFPDGMQGDGFYNKDAPDYFPDWIRTVRFPKREGGSFMAPIVDGNDVLIYLADQAVLTFHLYLSRTDDLSTPDKMIYDLDPPADTEDFGTVREAALAVRDVMDELDLSARVQTTGSRGFHVVIPVRRELQFEEVRRFAKDAARILVRREPKQYTLEQRKGKRKGRIFLDMLRNVYGATAVAPYSIRARPGAPVATPIDWDEVENGAGPKDWTMENIPARLAQKADPWAGMMRHARSLVSRRKILDDLLAKEEPAAEERD